MAGDWWLTCRSTRHSALFCLPPQDRVVRYYNATAFGHSTTATINGTERKIPQNAT